METFGTGGAGMPGNDPVRGLRGRGYEVRVRSEEGSERSLGKEAARWDVRSSFGYRILGDGPVPSTRREG